MKDAYSNDKLNHLPHTGTDSNDGVYVYHGDKIKLQFKVDNGYVTSVTIGQGETE